MYFFERISKGRRYRVVAQSVWDAEAKRSISRQVMLGAAKPPPVVDMSQVQVVGERNVGDVGALLWVAERLDVVRKIDEICGNIGAKTGPSVGEIVLAVAVQRACAPGPKCDLAKFLEGCLPRPSCLPASKFTGQTFHRLASQVDELQLDAAQIAIAKAAVETFKLSANVLAFDTTNFDTHIATTTQSELAQRGHAKSKRSDSV